MRDPIAKTIITTPTAMPAFAPELMLGDAAGMAVDPRIARAEVGDAMAVMEDVDEAVVAIEDGESVRLTATNLAFGSANAIAFEAFGCWSSRITMAISGSSSVKLDGQSSSHSH